MRKLLNLIWNRKNIKPAFCNGRPKAAACCGKAKPAVCGARSTTELYN